MRYRKGVADNLP